jgi:hypothetical protein
MNDKQKQQRLEAEKQVLSTITSIYYENKCCMLCTVHFQILYERYLARVLANPFGKQVAGILLRDVLGSEGYAEIERLHLTIDVAALDADQI